MDFYCTGIYRITCKATNKIYVGSSIDIYTRWSKHKSDLRKNKHINPHLQNSWNLYGRKEFFVEVLEVCDGSELLEREQRWIDKLQPEFNILTNVSLGPSTLTSKSYIVTSPSGEEFHVTNLAKFMRERKIPSNGLYAVARGEVNEANGWVARFSDESKESWSKKKKRSIKRGGGHNGYWMITHPNGLKEKVLSLTEFCKKHGLSQGSMSLVASGKRKQHNGFTVKKL